MKIYDIGEWSNIIYISLDEKEDRIEEANIYGKATKFIKLISGKGWSFLSKESIMQIQKSMSDFTKSVRIFSPRHGKVKIVFRQPGEMVYVIDQPRLPMFSILMHHHGKHKSTVDIDFKCNRCGKEVPAEVKALVLAETMQTF